MKTRIKMLGIFITYQQVLALLSRVCRQSNPLDLFLLLGDDVHSHEDIEGIVNSASDVLLVIGLHNNMTYLPATVNNNCCLLYLQSHC